MLRMRLCNWLTAVVVCLAAAQDSRANPPGQALDVASQPPGYLREMRFLDADRDRQIDAQEFADGQQAASLLLMLSWEDCDSDGDGVLSHAEFEAAADKATQALLETDAEADERAEQELAKAIPLPVLLNQLSQNDDYADELAELREAVEDLNDDEVVVTHIVQNPARYPHLVPVVRTWIRHYPVRPALRRHVKLGPVAPRYRLKHHAGPKPRPVKRGPAAKPGPKPHRPAPKPGPKPGPKRP